MRTRARVHMPRHLQHRPSLPQRVIYSVTAAALVALWITALVMMFKTGLSG